MKLNDWLELNSVEVCGDFRLIDVGLETNNGLIMSIQASKVHCCHPKETLPYSEYTSFEIGYPNKEIKDLIEYAKDKNIPTGTVYNYVPREVIEKVIKDNGGIKELEK